LLVRPLDTLAWVLLLSFTGIAGCGGEPRTAGSSASIAGWAERGDRGDERPASRRLGEGESTPAAHDDARRSRVLGRSAGPSIVRRGSLVDVRFAEAEVREAMRLLAEAAGLDVVVEEDVRGTVTLDLRDVRPFDAMEAIAAAHGARVELQGRLAVVRARR
jgi:hypothetical protein